MGKNLDQLLQEAEDNNETPESISIPVKVAEEPEETKNTPLTATRARDDEGVKEEDITEINIKQQKKPTKKENKEKVENIKNKEIIDNVVKKSKKNHKSLTDINPASSAQDALQTISKLTHEIEIDNIVSKILQRNDYNAAKEYSWQDAIRILENNKDKRNETFNKLITDLTENGTNLGNLDSRRQRYNEYQSSVKKLPILSKVLRMYTAHIISPDDLSKVSMRLIPVNSVLEDDEGIRTLIGKYLIIQNKINLEKMVYDVVYNSLLKGDYFVEIQSSKRSLIQTLYNLQIPITESLNMNQLTKNLSNTSRKKEVLNKDMSGLSNTNVKLIMEETLPISKQIDNTSKVVQEMVDNVLISAGLNIHNGLLTEEAIQEHINNNISLKNLMDVLFENLVGDVLIQEDFVNSDIKYKKDSLNKVELDNTRGDINLNDLKGELKHTIEALPIEASLSNINLKMHDPDDVIILKKDEICYGYLIVNGYSRSASSPNKMLSQLGKLSALGGTGSTNFMTASINNERLNNDALVNNFITQLSDFFKEKFQETDSDGKTTIDISRMAPGLQQLIADILSSNISNEGELVIRYIPPSNMQQFSRNNRGCYSPYGESLLDDSLFTARLLLCQNISDTLNKISRIGTRTVYKVKGNTNQQAMSNIQKVKNSVTKSIVNFDSFGSIDTIPSLITTQKSLYVPVVNSEEQIQIDTLKNDNYADTVNPYNQMIQQVIMGLDIPPAVLGIDQMTNSKASLAQEYLGFALNILSSQKEIGDQFTELMHKIYLALYLNSKSFDISYKRVKCVFAAPRGIMLNTIQENMQNLSNIVTALQNLGISQEKIIEKYMPELIDYDLKLNQAKESLNKKRVQNSNNGQPPSDGTIDGFAPFDLSAVPQQAPQQAPQGQPQQAPQG